MVGEWYQAKTPSRKRQQKSYEENFPWQDPNLSLRDCVQLEPPFRGKEVMRSTPTKAENTRTLSGHPEFSWY